MDKEILKNPAEVLEESAESKCTYQMMGAFFDGT